jgi:hypothetical protein
MVKTTVSWDMALGFLLGNATKLCVICLVIDILAAILPIRLSEAGEIHRAS